MRAAVARVLGPERAERFFDRLLDCFFAAGDARLLAELGVNCLRLPISYRHFESDAKPFELLEAGFERLDRAIRLCGEHGIYSVIDLHAVPGAQNQHWHSDNPTHVAAFWLHPHFQDRVVHLWEALADRFKDRPELATTCSTSPPTRAPMSSARSTIALWPRSATSTPTLARVRFRRPAAAG
jgi:hypothetical protein